MVSEPSVFDLLRFDCTFLRYICLSAELSLISVSRELVIKLVVTGKRIVEMWYFKSGGG